MKTPRHNDGQPESTIERHGLTFKIDRHAGTVIEGVGHNGKPYQVTQQGDYGYVHGLPGHTGEALRGDDGEGWDAYLGNDHSADRVYVVTQLKASNGLYDEQKGLFGFGSREEAQSHYLAHVHPTMLGRMGSLSLDAFHRQVRDHVAREAEVGARCTFRAETEEDAAEGKALEKLDLNEPEDGDEEPPDSE